MYRPREPKYAHAVGVCFRKMGCYEDAIRLFARTMELEPDDFGPAFQMVECMMLLGQRDRALQTLETIAETAGAGGQAAAQERAQALKDIIVDGAKP